VPATEDEYYLLYYSDIEKYPLIHEDCRLFTRFDEKSRKYKEVPAFPAKLFH